MTTTPQNGLLPLPPDDRDFVLGAVLELPALDTLPASYRVPEMFGIKDQKDSDFCTQFALCAISQEQELVELSPEWAFAMSKDLEGDYTTYGQDLRTACRVHVKYGALAVKDSPYSLENKSPDFLRNPEVWPVELMELAKPHQKKTYFIVLGPHDAFDNIRASMYALRDGVAIGVTWGWPLTQTHIDEPAPNGGGHAVKVVGWDNDYLIIKQSYGLDAGQDGYVYMSRKVINANVDRYGAFMLTDMPRDKVEKILSGDPAVTQLFAELIDVLKRLFARLFNR